MIESAELHEVFDLTDPDANVLFDMSLDDARERLRSGDVGRVRQIEGHFALVVREGQRVRMARSLQVPMRYFIVKQTAGPALLVAHRIDAIKRWLDERGLGDQFHPSYTRMVPAHYITEIALVGCPDPNPVHRRFFSPRREIWPDDLDAIGERYIGALSAEIRKWLRGLPEHEPIGVSFSGGIDSGAVFLALYHEIRRLGLNPARLKAFTLSVGRGGADLEQARRFLAALDLQLYHEPVEVPAAYLDLRETIRVIEDYKPLDIQSGAMALALCRGIRERYPSWRHLVDGDGGDENLKDYPIEENPELTIRSVLNNLMLYHEGWGVDSIKHSLTYSGGLSRGCTRGFAPASHYGFKGFSPFTLPNVVEVSEGIPFIELTEWDHERLYRLKGEIVSRGIRALTGFAMPVFEKRRFQHGALAEGGLARRLPESPTAYRVLFQSIFDDPAAAGPG
ncbi:MAG: asparagine synthetase B family protein [Deltaproteobacteria bacterium]|nr:asparagine synthetase B family protein [Deltaproteobacteria bacterium]MBW2386160.1 asparagine synthetase B family protein [Deltaproteobacteria bacterium]MBW2697012.1 asparagine synthetase B family protein [Deltaproteobacteria bacterium]